LVERLFYACFKLYDFLKQFKNIAEGACNSPRNMLHYIYKVIKSCKLVPKGEIENEIEQIGKNENDSGVW
jgi:hypothetical protein